MFFGPQGLGGPTVAPTVRGPGCPPAPPSDHWECGFEPRSPSPRSWFWGCLTQTMHILGHFLAITRLFLRHIVELEGNKGLFVITKSRTT